MKLTRNISTSGQYRCAPEKVNEQTFGYCCVLIREKDETHTESACIFILSLFSFHSNIFSFLFIIFLYIFSYFSRLVCLFLRHSPRVPPVNPWVSLMCAGFFFIFFAWFKPVTFPNILASKYTTICFQIILLHFIIHERATNKRKERPWQSLWCCWRCFIRCMSCLLLDVKK